MCWTWLFYQCYSCYFSQKNDGFNVYTEQVLPFTFELILYSIVGDCNLNIFHILICLCQDDNVSYYSYTL